MFVAGASPPGRVKTTPLAPFATAPRRCTTPLTCRSAALLVAKGAWVHPFCSASGVNPLAETANEAPSSEVKHWAFENVPPSA
jgi:hypothetical protein